MNTYFNLHYSLLHKYDILYIGTWRQAWTQRTCYHPGRLKLAHTYSTQRTT